MAETSATQERFEQRFEIRDTIDAQTKSAPAGAETPVGPGLAATRERLMTKRISAGSDHRQTCLVFLELAKNDLTTAKTARDHYIGLAHKYGLSNVEIGAAVGVTEARVRAILAGGA